MIFTLYAVMHYHLNDEIFFSTQALGIALETRRIDIFEKAVKMAVSCWSCNSVFADLNFGGNQLFVVLNS